ncbi:uncharacterized protein LOC763730 [Strongylocentrotus purpuratus]|uniref:Death domain-containing protein n=1 Tax=Strongylocentrotus purpuratus TaxID=7668 RepID=A0A7M7NE46_STRPU|nr:uncharacterized protein LOC763730 [Strongylocentrotus purpuratus]XP_030834223.1 uncharacterized protein LOC763730 [Strongylocentrotus purpuratus]
MPRNGDPTSYYHLNSNVPIKAPEGPLSDQVLWTIATNLTSPWYELAYALNLPDIELARIDKLYPTHPEHDRHFGALRDWRYRSLKLIPPHEAAMELSNSMKKLGRQDLCNFVLYKYQEALQCS